jgi:hypothetical protein
MNGRFSMGIEKDLQFYLENKGLLFPILRSLILIVVGSIARKDSSLFQPNLYLFPKTGLGIGH